MKPKMKMFQVTKMLMLTMDLRGMIYYQKLSKKQLYHKAPILPECNEDYYIQCYLLLHVCLNVAVRIVNKLNPT